MAKFDPQAMTQRLAKYWRERSGLPRTEFDSIDPARFDHSRFDIDEPEQIKLTYNVVSERVATGRPLTFYEYHFAIVRGWLVTDLMYERFFEDRWHETATHMAYRPQGKDFCGHCLDDAAKAARKTKHVKRRSSRTD